MNARSATDVEEKELVRWAFTTMPGSLLLARALEIAAADFVLRLEVGAPVFTHGDRLTPELDALLLPHGDPKEAVAVECKRLKISSSTIETGQIGKLNELRKLVSQANGHVARGFHKVFAVIFAVVDGRDMSGGSWLGGGMTLYLSKLIQTSPHLAQLDPGAGLVLFELRQPVDKDVLYSGGFGIVSRRPAIARDQPVDLTKRIEALVFGGDASSA